jgi:predicted nucleotidyltransferase
MKKISPEQFTETLRSLCGEALQSVVLYGSAAAGDYAAKGSDYNLLIVLEDLPPKVLRSLAKPVGAWERAGNPPPLLFTKRRLTEAADVFPVELLDMRDARRVLFGEDVIAGIVPDRSNLRLQAERELRSALIQLRRNYLISCDSSRHLAGLLTGSLSGVLSLFRAVLRLYEETVSPGKMEALKKLNGHIPVGLETFELIQSLKTGKIKAGKADVEFLFETYVRSIEAVVDAVDKI